MKQKTNVKRLVLSAMFLALAFVLPFLTGQMKQFGNMLCPMHLPVILCGFFCGGPWGLAVGFLAPLLRSFVLGMPKLFPNAICMAFELATYGFMAGLLHSKLPKKKISVYISLLSAMMTGRIVWGLVMFGCLGLDASKFGLTAFFTSSVLNAIPGIIVQIVLIPLLVITLSKITNKPD